MTLAHTIDEAWDSRETLNAATKGAVREAVEQALDDLDAGRLRVAEKIGGEWHRASMAEEGGAALLPPERHGADRRRAGRRTGGTRSIPNSPAGTRQQFRAAGFRAVPGAIVRHSAFIAKGVVLMPSFVNVGAYVGENTMVDTWATVGSCAQIGTQLPYLRRRRHRRRAGAVAGGTHHHRGQLLHRRAHRSGRRRDRRRRLGAVDGRLPRPIDQDRRPRDAARSSRAACRPIPSSCPGSLPAAPDKPALYCAVIVKRVDERTRAKTSINELLRD